MQASELNLIDVGIHVPQRFRLHTVLCAEQMEAEMPDYYAPGRHAVRLNVADMQESPMLQAFLMSAGSCGQHDQGVGACVT
jgi:hypothetical protein